MNITFMIGNGFDLNLGLQTSYSHFLKYYLAHIENDNENIKCFKERISQQWANWSDVELALGKCTADFVGPTCDNDFFECYDNIYDSLSAYLTEEEMKFDAVNEKTLNTGMLHALSQWSQGFRAKRQDAITNEIKKVPGGFVFNFIVFNYTYTLDKCIASIKNPQQIGYRHFGSSNIANSIGKIVHVHGYTDKDMILGVNDVSQISNTDIYVDRLVFDTDRLVKIEANHLFEENTDEKAYEILKNSDLVYVYGMSLGATDKLWWQRLGELIVKKPSLPVIIYSYNAPSDPLHYHRFLHHENRIRNKMEQYFHDDASGCSNNIHVTWNNIFSKLKNIVPQSQELSLSAPTISSTM